LTYTITSKINLSTYQTQISTLTNGNEHKNRFYIPQSTVFNRGSEYIKNYIKNNLIDLNVNQLDYSFSLDPDSTYSYSEPFGNGTITLSAKSDSNVYTGSLTIPTTTTFNPSLYTTGNNTYTCNGVSKTINLSSVGGKSSLGA
jgi:hypothetical protein